MPAPGGEPRDAVPFSIGIGADRLPMSVGRKQQRSHRRIRRQRRVPHRRAILPMLAVLAGIGLAVALNKGTLALPDVIAAQIPPTSDIVQEVGLGLDQVSISGLHSTSDEAVFKALDLDRTRSLWSLDTKAARLRLEELPWVASAELTRVYPGQLDVRITERAAFALWRHDGREELIDKTGRVLQAVYAGRITHLPVVAGEDAAHEAANLLVLLARYKPLAESFSWAERVNGRRWSVHLNTGGRIELPADGEALALSELEANGQLSALLADAPTIVDLRAPGRIAIRPAEGVTSSSKHRSVAGIGALIEEIGRKGGRP